MIRRPRRTSRIISRYSCALLAGVLLIPTLASAAETRLFTTPEQRQRLDELRAAATAEQLARKFEPEPEPKAIEPPPPKPPPRVHVRGYVKRSDGPSAVWVNQGSTLPGDRIGDDIRTGRIQGSTVIVTLPDGRNVRLKPGQTWDPQSGSVNDAGGG